MTKADISSWRGVEGFVTRPHILGQKCSDRLRGGVARGIRSEPGQRSRVACGMIEMLSCEELPYLRSFVT